MKARVLSSPSTHQYFVFQLLYRSVLLTLSTSVSQLLFRCKPWRWQTFIKLTVGASHVPDIFSTCKQAACGQRCLHKEHEVSNSVCANGTGVTSSISTKSSCRTMKVLSFPGNPRDLGADLPLRIVRAIEGGRSLCAALNTSEMSETQENICSSVSYKAYSIAG